MKKNLPLIVVATIMLVLVSVVFIWIIPKTDKSQIYQDSIAKANHQKVIHELEKSKFIHDSIQKANDSIDLQELKKDKAAYNIYIKHPEWDIESCKLLAKHRIWIGMTIGMVKYLRGLPNHINTSNYGNGNEYQWCWDNYNPSCFYGKSDGIITAYN